jgi:hypothetical protein
MAAGLGFKDFVTGEVLTAADVDGYLMQGVWVFASAAARDAAVTSPQEGNFAYLKDTNVTTYYTGSAWANLDTTGMTNPMTTTGDTIYSSSGSTPARLGIGSTGNVLTVAGGVPTWAAPASGGGMTLISETTASANSSITYSSLGSYKQLLLIWSQLTYSANGVIGLRFNNDSGNKYTTQTIMGNGASVTVDHRNGGYVDAGWSIFGQSVTSTTIENRSNGFIYIDNYTSTTKYKTYQGRGNWRDNQYSGTISVDFVGSFADTTAITSLDIYQHTSTPTFTNQTGGSFRLYGLS